MEMEMKHPLNHAVQTSGLMYIVCSDFLQCLMYVHLSGSCVFAFRFNMCFVVKVTNSVKNKCKSFHLRQIPNISNPDNIPKINFKVKPVQTFLSTGTT